MNHEQHPKLRSVKILAKINPRGRAIIIIIAAAPHENASTRDMVPKL